VSALGIECCRATPRPKPCGRTDTVVVVVAFGLILLKYPSIQRLCAKLDAVTVVVAIFQFLVLSEVQLEFGRFIRL
jgi:hypothetical protein